MVDKVELLEELDSKSVKENKQWVNVTQEVFSEKTRPVMEREISTKTRKERTKKNITSTIKAERKILHKERKNWNKHNREMIKKPYENLNKKSIIGLGIRDQTNTEKLENNREMTWSSQEHGIDERLGKFKYLMYPR